jgi:hypothetical protein
MQGVSKVRNRVIGRVFHELHLIEELGQRDSADDRGLPGRWPGSSQAGRKAFSVIRERVPKHEVPT